MPPRAGAERLLDILDALVRIRSYCDGLSFEDFRRDSRTVEAVQFNFIVIGEAARSLPEQVTALRPDLPWAEMRGLRNVVAHAYFAVSLEILWETITGDLPPLEPAVRALLEEISR